MRRLAHTFLFTLLTVGVVSAQGPAPVQYPYGLDPYKPSDADLLRRFGSALVAQTPLLELRKLDPYKPSHAALLRDLGGAIPWWAYWYPPAPGVASPAIFSHPGGAVSSTPIVVYVAPLPDTDPAPSPVTTSPPSPTSVVTLSRPENNDGVWISYAGQRWISSGAAIPFDGSRFARAGQYGSFTVYRSVSGPQDFIYLPTRSGLVAPYRLKQ